MLQKLRAVVCMLALSTIACTAGAQAKPDYPKRPVRFIVAQTTGGNADFVGRILAEALGKRFGQQFVVDNRAGASGGEPVGNTPDEFARWLKVEIAKWTKVVKEANIRAE